MRLFGTQVAGGFSSEARVFAGLLAERSPDIDPLVLHHDWPGDRASADRFEEAAAAPLARFDVGWRPNPDGSRALLAKVGSHLRLEAALPRVQGIARRFAPDVVYSCQQKWDCRVSSTVAARLHVPQVIHLHYIMGPWLGAQALARLRACDHVVAVSDFIRSDAIRHGVPAGRITTVRNTMRPTPPPDEHERAAIRAELGLPRDAFVAGIVARIDPGKGQADTITAFDRLARPNTFLVVVGEGPLRPALERQARASTARDRIIFTGFRSDVSRLLCAFDVFVHPSRLDPCPLAVLEAAASGLPVVAYAEGGIPELVTDAVTGLLPPSDDVDALSASLSRLAADDDLRRRMGAAARERIEREFRPEFAGDAFSQLLHEVLERRQAGPLVA